MNLMEVTEKIKAALIKKLLKLLIDTKTASPLSHPEERGCIWKQKHGQVRSEVQDYPWVWYWRKIKRMIKMSSSCWHFSNCQMFDFFWWQYWASYFIFARQCQAVRNPLTYSTDKILVGDVENGCLLKLFPFAEFKAWLSQATFLSVPSRLFRLKHFRRLSFPLGVSPLRHTVGQL